MAAFHGVRDLGKRPLSLVMNIRGNLSTLGSILARRGAAAKTATDQPRITSRVDFISLLPPYPVCRRRLSFAMHSVGGMLVRTKLPAIAEQDEIPQY